MDAPHDVDPGRFRRIIEGYDVVILRFDLVEPRLLVDSRQQGGVPPLVTLIPRVENMHQRLRMLHEIRPGLGTPEAVRILRWPRTVASLQRLGVWQHIERRCGSGWDHVLRELAALEHQAMQNAVRGDGFQALWERSTRP